MLQNDYILRIILDMAIMIRKSWGLPELDKKSFSDDIEEAVGEAVGIDPKLFFSFEPDSAVSMMEMGDIDHDVAAYVTQAMFLEAKVLEGQGDMSAAALRRRQAIAIAKSYGTNIPSEAESAEGLVQFFIDDPLAEGQAGDRRAGAAQGDPNDAVAASPDPATEGARAPRGAAALGLAADKLRIDDL